jgi:hypothetical protein
MDKLTIEQAVEISEHGFLAPSLANKNIMGMTSHIAWQLADTMRENERLRDALEKLKQMGIEGMEPDPTRWLAFHDKVALIAHDALHQNKHPSQGHDA